MGQDTCKLLFLGYYFEPDITAAAFRSTDFVEYMRGRNVDVRVITSYPHKIQGEEGLRPENPDQIRRIKLKKVKQRGFMGFLLHYLSFIPKSLVYSLKWRFRGWKPDVVFISSPPIFIGITGVMLRFLFRKKLILEIRDIWPDSAVAAGQLSKGGVAYKVASVFERFLYRRSHGIVCVSTPMKEYIQQYYRRDICVAYNGPKAQYLSEVTKDFNNNDNRTARIAYAGNLGLVQGMDQLIKAFDVLKSRELAHDWHLDIYGTGVLEEDLQKMSKDLGLHEKIHFHGVFPKAALSEHLNNSDVLYLGLISSEALDKTIPSKLFDYMMFGKPILAAITGEGKDILNENKANLVLESCTDQAIASGIMELDISLKERSLSSERNRELLQGKYTREVNCEKIHRYILKVLEK